jgi:hypothetical protein
MFLSTFPPYSAEYGGDFSPSSLDIVPGFLPLGIKEAQDKDDHAPASVAEIKNEWRCASALPISFHGVLMDEFRFTLRS